MKVLALGSSLLALGLVMVVVACGSGVGDGGAPPAAPSSDGDASPETGAGAVLDAGALAERANTAGACGAALFATRWGSDRREGLFGAGESAAAIAAGSDGSVYLTGWVDEGADLGEGPSDAGGANPFLFLVKLDDRRASAFSHRFGDSRATLFTVPFARGLVLAAHPGGGVVVGGSFAGELPLGGAPLVSAGGCVTGVGDCQGDAFVARFDGAGARVFGTRFGALGADGTHGVAVLPNGDVVVAGSFEKTIDVGPLRHTSAGANDVFVAQLDGTDGTPRSSFRFGGSGAETVAGVAVLADGDLVVAGAFAGSLPLDGAAAPLTAKGAGDAYVARLSPSGVARWALALGATKSASVTALAVDPSGIYVAGSFAGTITLGAGDQMTARRIDDAYVAKLGADGKPSWARTFGGDGNDHATSLAVDSAGAVLVGGETDSITGVDYGGGVIGGGTTGGPFLVDLDAAGSHRCSRVYPTTPSTPDDAGVAFALGTASAVAAMGTKSVFIAGTFGGTLDFGKGTVRPLTAAGGVDVFAAELAR